MNRALTCSIPGCTKRPRSRSWCHAHYVRWRRHGDPLGGRRTMTGEPERYFREVVLTYEGDECLIWPFTKGGGGYGNIWLNGRNNIVSRLVCIETNGQPPTPEHEAAHSCGKGYLACVTKRHLSWKTPTGNQADRLIHGTHIRGERNCNAKLTEDKVREIRELRGKMLRREIAEMFGVGSTSVRNIFSGKTWEWLS